MKYRELKHSDLRYLYKLVNELWCFDTFGPQKEIAKILTSSAVTDIIANTNYSIIACNENNQPIGFLLAMIANNPTQKNVNINVRYTKIDKELSKLTAINNDALNQYLNIRSKFLQLKKNINRGGNSAEIVWFATDPNFQGQGIGSKLLTKFTIECNKLGITQQFLLTDEQCSYQYYDKHGFTQLQHIQATLKLKEQTQSNNIFLYFREI
jgi:ribosomal protein S18 acetylase RimI-like enzyme